MRNRLELNEKNYQRKQSILQNNYLLLKLSCYIVPAGTWLKTLTAHLGVTSPLSSIEIRLKPSGRVRLTCRRVHARPRRDFFRPGHARNTNHTPFVSLADENSFRANKFVLPLAITDTYIMFSTYYSARRFSNEYNYRASTITKRRYFRASLVHAKQRYTHTQRR